MPDEVVSHRLQTWFDSYLRVCNRHTFGELEAFVAPEVRVNGALRSRDAYLAELRTVARGFPDYRRTVQRLVLNDGWLAAHCLATGTHLGTFLGFSASGVRVRTEEYSLYRITDFMITEIRLSTDHRELLEQIRRHR